MGFNGIYHLYLVLTFGIDGPKKYKIRIMIHVSKMFFCCFPVCYDK